MTDSNDALELKLDSPGEDDILSAKLTEDADDSKGGKKKKKGSKGRSVPRGVETMFRTSYRVHMDLSGIADTKANIMISINGIIISIIIASISPKIDANPWLLLPTIVLLLTCLISIVHAVLAARPRVSSSMVDLEQFRKQRSNILFFGHYVHMSEKDYVQGMKELMDDEPGLYQNMIRDIYGLGKVLDKKFALLRKSYNAFMIGLVAGILTFLGVFIWVVLWQETATTFLP